MVGIMDLATMGSVIRMMLLEYVGKGNLFFRFKSTVFDGYDEDFEDDEDC